jgi:hypothetical protein
LTIYLIGYNLSIEVIGMDDNKRSFSIDGGMRTIETRQGLWDAFDDAIKSDPMERFTNRSECIRYYITKFIEDVEERKAK